MMYIIEDIDDIHENCEVNFFSLSGNINLYILD